MKEILSVFLFKKIENSNEAYNLIKLSSSICIAYAFYSLIIVAIFLDFVKIPLAFASVFIVIGIGLIINKSRELALFLLILSCFTLIEDITNNTFNLFIYFLVFAGIQALRGCSAYYRFKEASISVKSFFAKLLISWMYYILLGVIIVLINPNIIGFPISREIFGAFFSIINYLGFSGILPLTNRFKIVSYKLSTINE